MSDIIERLRTDVLWHERRCNDTIAADCREAADELARLRAEVEALTAEANEWRKLRDPTNLHANLLRGLPAKLTPAQVWHLVADDRDRLADLEAEVEALTEHLRFVERWANHHGAKPGATAEQALSVIQHYPPIVEITRSYADGKVPATPDPWAEVEALRADAKRWRFVRHLDGFALDRMADQAETPSDFDAAIDAAMRADK